MVTYIPGNGNSVAKVTEAGHVFTCRVAQYADRTEYRETNIKHYAHSQAQRG